ncbi:MAG TPA: ABC transporter permease subunit/CPBP intramembrane protease, partial [Pirellulales bacterium]|nr:ABC transporter permease subunit/CPBP intramembrane protease [Pirellulales bacterium]
MRWKNIKLILVREIRDQLRDRRTLFMIAVLPLVLYPLLGMSFFQVTQFMREHTIRVLMVGTPTSPALPPLVQDGHFASALFSNPSNGRLMHLTLADSPAEASQSASQLLEVARRDMQAGNFDVVVFFPPDFATQFEQFHKSLIEDPASGTAEVRVPRVEIYPNLSKDASKTAHNRVSEVLDHWREEIGKQNLKDRHLPTNTASPFEIATLDVAGEGQHKAALWSKILPFVLLIWALTGAFYPAIDLCAGEKERGTLETLLSSPAERIEIVWGKLLTVMVFSMSTALLNLMSLTITGSLVLSQLPNLGPPPGLAIVWLAVALVPVSALFSALCLALAAFARSNKEGQYYLMPLVLVTMPLTILPMAPGVELTIGNALVPVTGLVLLLRSMLEGNYLEALPYIPLVTAVTLLCCWLAIRWATNQFNTESVLFRESERWDLGLWIKHLLRDREPTPSFAEAMFCGVLILMIRFFLNFALPAPQGFRDFVMLAAVTQLVVVLSPALFMTIMLTRSPAQTLLLRRPPLMAALAAVLLAVVVNPAANLLQTLVIRVYPLNEELARVLQELSLSGDNLAVTILVIAILPAICEELAF